MGDISVEEEIERYQLEADRLAQLSEQAETDEERLFLRADADFAQAWVTTLMGVREQEIRFLKGIGR